VGEPEGRPREPQRIDRRDKGGRLRGGVHAERDQRIPVAERLPPGGGEVPAEPGEQPLRRVLPRHDGGDRGGEPAEPLPRVGRRKRRPGNAGNELLHRVGHALEHAVAERRGDGDAGRPRPGLAPLLHRELVGSGRVLRETENDAIGPEGGRVRVIDPGRAAQREHRRGIGSVLRGDAAGEGGVPPRRDHRASIGAAAEAISRRRRAAGGRARAAPPRAARPPAAAGPPVPRRTPAAPRWGGPPCSARAAG
jgi:hypothetical protein